jgi:hypothetical protein
LGVHIGDGRVCPPCYLKPEERPNISRKQVNQQIQISPLSPLFRGMAMFVDMLQWQRWTGIFFGKTTIQTFANN